MYNTGPPLSPVRGRDMKTTQKDREIMAICAALGYKVQTLGLVLSGKDR